MATWEFAEGTIEGERVGDELALRVVSPLWMVLNGSVAIRIVVTTNGVSPLVELCQFLCPVGFALIDPAQAIEVIRAWSEGRAPWLDVEAVLGYS